MLTYIGRRLLQFPIVLFGVTSLIFALVMALTPVQRLSLYVSADDAHLVDFEKRIKFYHLDDPVPLQYLNWIKGVLAGDLGISYVGKQPVASLLAQSLPVSAELALWAVMPIMLIGVQLGVTSAVHRNKPLDHFIRLFSLVGWCIPIFVFGLLALMLFYARLDWLPPGRASAWAEEVILGDSFVQYTHMYTIDALLNGRPDIFLDALKHLFMPILSLSYVSWALFQRITRSSMLEELRQDYIVTARAKGLPEHMVIHKHAKRNAMIPIVTIGGLTVAQMMGGVVIVETIFNIHGVGWNFATAAVRLDIPTVIGFTLFYSTIVAVANLVTDILYAFLDPRVRYL